MRSVTGYLTSDGQFFEDHELALFHEAQITLKTKLEQSMFTSNVKFSDLVDVLKSYHREIVDFCLTYGAISEKTDAERATDKTIAATSSLYNNSCERETERATDECRSGRSTSTRNHEQSADENSEDRPYQVDPHTVASQEAS